MSAPTIKQHNSPIRPGPNSLHNNRIQRPKNQIRPGPPEISLLIHLQYEQEQRQQYIHNTKPPYPITSFNPPKIRLRPNNGDLSNANQTISAKIVANHQSRPGQPLSEPATSNPTRPDPPQQLVNNPNSFDPRPSPPYDPAC